MVHRYSTSEEAMSTLPQRIDDDFIVTWHPRNCEMDEGEYDAIVSQVRSEVQQTGTIIEKTFKDIVYWKWEAMKGKINWADVGNYLEKIREVASTRQYLSDVETLDKMNTLITLPL